MKAFNILKKIFKRKKQALKINEIRSKDTNKLRTNKQNVFNIISSGETNINKILDKIECSIPHEQTLYKLSKFFSNFSDNTRLKIISCLSFGELCVSDIAKVLNMNQTTISHQLAYLKSSGTVTARREGKTIYYSLSTTEIQECLTCGANFVAL